jgi:hypothetical protein
VESDIRGEEHRHRQDAAGAVRGKRFDEKGKPKPGYQDARMRLVLGPAKHDVTVA